MSKIKTFLVIGILLLFYGCSNEKRYMTNFIFDDNDTVASYIYNTKDIEERYIILSEDINKFDYKYISDLCEKLGANIQEAHYNIYIHKNSFVDPKFYDDSAIYCEYIRVSDLTMLKDQLFKFKGKYGWFITDEVKKSMLLRGVSFEMEGINITVVEDNPLKKYKCILTSERLNEQQIYQVYQIGKDYIRGDESIYFYDHECVEYKTGKEDYAGITGFKIFYYSKNKVISLDDPSLLKYESQQKEFNTSDWIEYEDYCFKYPTSYDKKIYEQEDALYDIHVFQKGEIELFFMPSLGTWATIEYPDKDCEVSYNSTIDTITYKANGVFSGYVDDGRIFYMKKLVNNYGELGVHSHYLGIIYPQKCQHEVKDFIEMIKKWKLPYAS